MQTSHIHKQLPLLLWLGAACLVGQSCKKDPDTTVTPTPTPTALTVSAFSPASGVVGSVVTIDGTGFSDQVSDNVVKFNGTPATVETATTTRLTAKVPSGATSGVLTVEVGSKAAVSTSQFSVTPPPPVYKAFGHVAASGTVSGNYTVINDANTNGNPSAIVIATANWQGGSIYNPHPVGVWYTGSKWAVYNQDLVAMPTGVKFNVLVVPPGDKAYRHIANTGNISGHITTLDHPLLNNQPNARFLVTPNWNNATGVYNNSPVGVYYSSGRWRIFNQNTSIAIKPNAEFNVVIDPDIFVAENTSSTNNWFVFDHAATNSKPNALVFATQYWTSVYNNQEIGVWYTSNKWSVYNQKNSVSMPTGAKFNILAINP